MVLAGRCVAACLWQAFTGLSCHPGKLHVEFLVYFPCLKAKIRTASPERTEKMGSDSHHNGAAGRVKQPQSDLEQC